MTLVQGLYAKKAGGGPTGKCDTLVPPPYSGDIVGRVVDGGFPNIKLLYQHVMLGDSCCTFQFTVVDIPARVVKCDQLALDVIREGASSHERLYSAIQLCDKMDPTHADDCGILISQGVSCFLPDDVRDAHRSLSQVRSEPSEVSKDLLYRARQPYTLPLITPCTQHFSKHTKHPLLIRNG
jgi:hypothetical protein